MRKDEENRLGSAVKFLFRQNGKGMTKPPKPTKEDMERPVKLARNADRGYQVKLVESE